MERESHQTKAKILKLLGRVARAFWPASRRGHRW